MSAKKYASPFIGAPDMRRNIASWPTWVSASANGPRYHLSSGASIGASEASAASIDVNAAWKRVICLSHVSTDASFHWAGPRSRAAEISSRSPMCARISIGGRVAQELTSFVHGDRVRISAFLPIRHA